MPDFHPFGGIHYDTGRFGTDISALTAPPYDVIDDDRLAHLRALNEFNAVHLTLPEGGDDRYERAGAAFRSWLDTGVLVPADHPRLYLYRVDFRDDDGTPRQMTGVIGALDLRVPGDGDVLPHERTMSKPKGDRLDLLRATRANLEPIWGLSLSADLSSLLVPEGDPVVSCRDTHEAEHRLFAVADADRVAAIVAAVASTPVVIADGHHRYETSLHYQRERRAAGARPGAHDSIMTMVVELSDEQLAVKPIHRVIASLPDPAVLRTALEDAFEIVPVGPNEPDVVARLGGPMADQHAMALVDRRQIALLVPRPSALERALTGEPDSMRDVDAARFESLVAPLLESLAAEVTYRHDRATVADQVRKGIADAGVLLRAVDVPTIRLVAERGERMPQKTTFFHPKPSTGLVFRSLDT